MGRMTGTWRRIGTGRSRGIALLIVLWGLVLLAVIAAAFTTETRTEMALARNLAENAKARALAEAGVYRAILALLQPRSDLQWRVDGTTYPFDYGEGAVRISVQDEGGKIDLNMGRDEHLRGLLQQAGLDFDEAAALVDAIAGSVADCAVQARRRGADPGFEVEFMPGPPKTANAEA